MLLRRALRRHLVRVSIERQRFLEGFLEGGGCYRRRLEGRNTPFRRVRPPSRDPWSIAGNFEPQKQRSKCVNHRALWVSDRIPKRGLAIVCGIRWILEPTSDYVWQKQLLWKLASALDSWALKPSCNFLRFPAMCPPENRIFLQKTAFFCRNVHFSAGKLIFLQFAQGGGSRIMNGSFVFLDEKPLQSE